MSEHAATNPPGSTDPTQHEKARVLIVDDEERFRKNLAQRLELRGYKVKDVASGEDAIKAVRRGHPDVVLLDLRMPGMQGEEVLKEIKRIAPEVQVVILTGHASINSATETGRMDAYAYLEKPCETESLISTIDSARQEKSYALARHEMPKVDTRTVWSRMWGTHGFRPVMMVAGAALFAAVVLFPTPRSLIDLLSAPKTGSLSDPIAGYSGYAKMQDGECIADAYSQESKAKVEVERPDGKMTKRPLNAEETAVKAKVMLGILLLAALFWATGALPIGITALLVGLIMYVMKVFPPDVVAKSFAKDAVIFIMGVLAMAVGIGKTGLDRRIGLLLLGTSRSPTAFLFIFLPLLAVSASFLSEHALVAFIAPILMVVYMSAVKTAHVGKDKALAVMFTLGLCYAANQGGPGSPAAGGRNAVMIGILADYGTAPSFGEWVKYGMPFVPVMALVIATYFFLVFRGRIKAKNTNIAEIVRKESQRLGRMTGAEWVTCVILLGVIVMWITLSETLGMGGPVLIGLVAMAVFRIITWRDINKITWDVVALYASACAMGVGLASTGAALWLAKSFVDVLPEFLSSGPGLAIASSFFTGVLTNFMSDGATVSALGPITVPMASISGTHPWMVGLATAFASSFANALIIGTPNNAIAFSLAKDMDTGEQLVTLGDFLKHGTVITILSFLVLWGWTILGYWQWIGFK